MPLSDKSIDLEETLRSTLAGASVTAFSRGIGLFSHVDNRLPRRVEGDAAGFADYLRHGLNHTLAARSTQRIALAVWRGGDDQAPPVLEAARWVDPDRTPARGLAGLWAGRIGGTDAAPRPRPTAAGVESVLVPLPAQPGDGPTVGDQWGASFRDKRLMMVERPALCTEWHAESIAALGMELSIVDDARDVLACARAGGTPDLLVLDADFLGDDASRIARQFREDPVLAEAAILLLGDHLDRVPGGGEPGLFDMILRPPLPWRRLNLALYELIQAGTDERTRLSPGTAPERIPDLTGRRVLIAEDVATNQLLLRAILAPTGAGIEVLADGAELVARQEAEPADLVVLDLQMPGMGGIAAIRQIRAMPGPAGAVKAIALTAYAGAADRRHALAEGMDAYLAKPVVVDAFYDLVGKLLEIGR
ncbi:MAG: response regulator [Paracoccaceae bacterium]|nr:response regulator [Paracoccaceae bacterium]